MFSVVSVVEVVVIVGLLVVGSMVGSTVGAAVGVVDGNGVGIGDGDGVGSAVGSMEGPEVGACVPWSSFLSNSQGMVSALFQSLSGKMMVTVSHPPPSVSSMQCGQSIHRCSFSSYSTWSTIMCPIHNWSEPGCTICTL